MERFVLEDAKLYKDMFDFETSPVSMGIAQKKFIFEWLTSHPDIFEHLQARQLGEVSAQDRDDGTDDFLECYKAFIKNYLSDEQADGGTVSDALVVLTDGYLIALSDLLEMNKRSQARLDGLRYQQAKSNILFERTLKQLQG